MCPKTIHDPGQPLPEAAAVAAEVVALGPVVETRVDHSHRREDLPAQPSNRP